MKNQLTIKNLITTHYESENGNHILEFDLNGQTILITIRGLGPVENEFYWDDQTTLARALAKVEADDIEIQEPTVRTLRACADMTQKEFAEFTEIPQRTIEGWESGRRQPPAYLVKLIEHKIKEVI